MIPPSVGKVANGATGGAANGGVGEGERSRSGGGRTTDRLTGLILLACVLFNPPVLRAFGAGDMLFGWPLIYVYIFFVWGAVIVLAALLLDRDGGG